jgi:hypothetical protein
MFKKTLLALALAAVSISASALTFERTTTIKDDFNGRVVVQAAGTLGDENGSRVSEARFTNFHPRTQDRWADGTVSREAVRDGELVTVTYDGSITLSGNPASGNGNGNGNSQQLAISFVDLKIVKNAEEGPDLQGQLVVNGQTVDAATAPAQVRAVLLGLLRFFRV